MICETIHAICENDGKKESASFALSQVAKPNDE